MATNLSMNGVSLNGTPIANLANPKKPNSIDVKLEKIGKVQVMASGSRVWIQRLDGSSNPIYKRTWEVSWELANEVTRLFLNNLNKLTTTWTFIDQLGASYTVQTEEGDLEENYVSTDPGGNVYYAMKLTIREA